MTENLTTAAGRAHGAAVGSTRTLLTCGVVAGPLYIVVVVLQMLTRDGFDISRHPASMLSNGDQGWIQIANFVVSGLLFVACAIGMHRVLGPAAGRGGTWGPRLVGVFGAGMVAAAIFSADPADGFPPGTPAGPPPNISWHGIVHFFVAGVAFLALGRRVLHVRLAVRGGRPPRLGGLQHGHRRGLPGDLDLDLRAAGRPGGQCRLRRRDRARPGMDVATGRALADPAHEEHAGMTVGAACR
jgi:hypothetical protein